MPRAYKTPVERATKAHATVDNLRKRYRDNTKIRRRLLPVEEKHVANMLVVLKLAGYTRTQMATIVGVSVKQVGEILSKPDTLKLLENLRERLPNAALELLHGYMIEAVQALVDVMRTADDPRYVLQAAESILDRGGVPKASRQERQITTEEHHMVAEDFFEKLRTASPEIQEKAAQMVDELENFLSNSLLKEKPDEEA